MNSLPLGYLLGFLLFLILCSAFFSSSETGLLSLNRYRLRHLQREGHKGAQRAGRLLNQPDRLLGTILVGNNVVNILAASIATVVAVDMWGDAGVAIATTGLTIVLLIFSEITPKTLAALRPETIAFPASRLLSLLMLVLYPVVWLTSAISNILIRMLGINPKERISDALSTEELRSVVREAGDDLPEQRQDMLLGILDLENVTVNDVMIPRNEIIGIDLNDNLDHIVWQLRTTSHTRLPVYRDNINQIIGVVHMRQIARLLTLNKLTHAVLEAACVEPYFIPEDTPLSVQLLNFQKHKKRMGIVVDEYGDIEGLVTLEDILEEIVGELSDKEQDQEAEITQQAENSYEIDGTAYIRDINKILGWELPCDGPKTLNGLITEILESIPEGAVCVKIGPYLVETLEVRDNRISKARLTLLE
ncbi:HlyC/CorC family transporter [Thiopseudomonas denitrificans]|uniref:Magnesium and cobalt efflux protein CorC n=1 Tax=Thiopseudomonas denitrificans TaxID=1501432 RepID=A0A4R6TYV7_9GAMM|nr:HlyC/CorC family transporter [Thiopseudomonas denitrificans]TDQ38526.1 Mg2+/Co2+ transporter CorB [Thiopseudomonas denitrificans]